MSVRQDPSFSIITSPADMPATNESELKKKFIERHRDELVAELAGAWRSSVESPRFLEFLKTHGALDAEESETIARSGQSKRRAEALVSLILSKEDVRSLWKSFWSGLSRYSAPVVRRFFPAIERELGYQALDGITLASGPGDQPSLDGSFRLQVPAMVTDRSSVDGVSGGTSDPEATSRRAGGALPTGRSTASDGRVLVEWERQVDSFREERDAARKERAEYQKDNQRLTSQIYVLKEENGTYQKMVTALEAANRRLNEENAKLNQQNGELAKSVQEIRASHRREVISSQATMENLMKLQEKDKDRQDELLTWSSRVQERDDKVKELTALVDSYSLQLTNEKAQLASVQLQLDRLCREAEDNAELLKSSIPVNCVRFAQCRHSISDSGVQSQLSEVTGSGDVPFVFLREVEFDVRLPLETASSNGIVADNALLIKKITDSSMAGGTKLLVGDEVREVNGDVCSDPKDFQRLLMDLEQSSLNVSIRRRLVLRECPSCRQETGTMSSPTSNVPPTAGVTGVSLLEPNHNPTKRLSNAGRRLSPVPVSSLHLDDERERPQSSAGMCALSTNSSTLHHKTEIGAGDSTEKLPAELATSEKSPSEQSPSPEAIALPKSPARLKPIRQVKLMVDGLAAYSDSEASPRPAKSRSWSIPHLQFPSQSQRRASEPYAHGASSLAIFLRRTPSHMSQRSGDRLSLGCNELNPDASYRKVDQPMRLSESVLKKIGVGSSGRREIGLHRVGASALEDDPFAQGEVELIGGRACGTFIRSAPEWVLNHGVRIGDRLLYVQCKDVRNAPRQLVQFCMDNTISFSGVGHIVVQTNEEEWERVKSGKAKEDFYVRANFNYVANRQSELYIASGDILHVKDSMHNEEIGRWLATKVEHYKDTEVTGIAPCPQTARKLVIETCRSNRGGGGVGTDYSSPDPADQISQDCDIERRSAMGCSPHIQHQPPSGTAMAAGNGEGGLLSRARHLFGKGGNSGNLPRRGSKTVTQLASDIAGGHSPSKPTPPYEYIELVKPEKARPVIIFGSFITNYVQRELQRLYGSCYAICKKTYCKTQEERAKRMELGELVYLQPIETPSGFKCITVDDVKECLAEDLCPLMESDMSCIRRLQQHGLYAITVCLKPTSKSKFKTFVETLSGRPCTDKEVSEELAGVKASYETYKHILSDVMEINANPDKEIARLHRLIQKNLRGTSWVSSYDQPDFVFEPDR